MLVALTIRDIVLIDTLQIEVEDGLTVLTGETGAGKSILMDALALALGSRGDAGLVRQGASRGQVTAEFQLPGDHPVFSALADNDIECDGQLILRRVQAADGRTRAYVNDQPVSAGLLKSVGVQLVEIHGQHDDRALVQTDTHRGLLDAFGGLQGSVAKVRADWAAWRIAREDLDRLRARVEAAERDRDYLTACVEELRLLDPKSGEEEELARARQLMMQAEKIAEDLTDAYETVSGSASPIPVLSGLLRRLERKAGESPDLLGEPVNTLARALDALQETASGLERAIHAGTYDPGELERTEERLFALRAAGRKHGVSVDQLTDLREKMTADLEAIESGADRLARLAADVEAAAAQYNKSAADLSARRKKAAKSMERAANGELGDLKLEKATFHVNMTGDPSTAGADGFDTVEYWVQTNPGTRPGPLMKVASGGELARFLLAIKVALADRGSAPTLIFDEIDTGVGGAVAEAIGVRLARLAQEIQVLAVTHAPQVAARAARHLLISKETVAPDAVRTGVVTILDDQRREEIARMLAGARITDAARAAADQLLVAHD